MNTPVTPPPTSPVLLPENVAVIRALLAEARAQATDYRKVRYFSRVASRIWQVGDLDVIVRHNKRTWLVVRHGGGHVRIEHPVTSAQQVADLLYAVGLVPVELTSGYVAAKAEPIERATAAGLGQVLDIDQMRRVDKALLNQQAEWGHGNDCGCDNYAGPATCLLDGMWATARTVIDALQLPEITTTRKEGS